jgi:hypothetical protein
VLTQTQAVMERIYSLVSSDSPHPVPLPVGARGRRQKP